MRNYGAPLTMHSDIDKLVVAYDSNRIGVFDLINKQLHPWTVQMGTKLPRNFLTRYNRFYGIQQLSESKYVLYTHYTFSVLDLNQEIPEQSLVVENHP